MAKVSSILKLRGSVGDVVISGTPSGGSRAYLKGGTSKKKWYRTQRHGLGGRSAQEFGGAAKCGSAIYKDICYENTTAANSDEPQFAPYSHNRIARRLRKYGDKAGGTSCTRYHFAAAIPALQGLDLSPKGSPAKQVTIQPIGPLLSPTHLRLQGLRDAAEAIRHNAQDRLECRILIRHTTFPEVHFDADDFKWTIDNQSNPITQTATMWFPVDIIPAEGIKMALQCDAPVYHCPERAEQPTLHFAVVQWRTVSPRKKPKNIRGHNIIRYAAATVPPSLQESIQASLELFSAERKHNKRFRPTASRKTPKQSQSTKRNTERNANGSPHTTHASKHNPSTPPTIAIRKPLQEALPGLFLRFALTPPPKE